MSIENHWTLHNIWTSLKFIKNPFSQRSRFFSGLDLFNKVIHVSGFVDHLNLLCVSNDERILSLPNSFTLKLKCNKETFQIKVAFKEMLGSDPLLWLVPFVTCISPHKMKIVFDAFSSRQHIIIKKLLKSAEKCGGWWILWKMICIYIRSTIMWYLLYHKEICVGRLK